MHHKKSQLRSKCAAVFSVAVIGLASLSLCIALATRTFHSSTFGFVNAQSTASQGIRQHLDRDAIQWTPSVATFSVLEAPTFYPRLRPAGPPVAATLFHKSLYNRPPPPSC